MAFTESAQVVTQAVYDILTVLDVPAPPWPEERPLVESWITAAGQTTSLSTVNIGRPIVFASNDRINVPMLIVDPYSAVITEREGNWGTLKSPAHLFDLGLYYVMAKDDLVDGADRGSIGDTPEFLVLERAGALRYELAHEDNWKNLQGTHVFMTETTQPSLENDFQDGLQGDNIDKFVSAFFIVAIGVAEEPIS